MDNVKTETKDNLLIITVDRPKVLNALNAQTVAEIGEAFAAARDDDCKGTCDDSTLYLRLR